MCSGMCVIWAPHYFLYAFILSPPHKRKGVVSLTDHPIIASLKDESKAFLLTLPVSALLLCAAHGLFSYRRWTPWQQLLVLLSGLSRTVSRTLRTGTARSPAPDASG